MSFLSLCIPVKQIRLLGHVPTVVGVSLEWPRDKTNMVTEERPTKETTPGGGGGGLKYEGRDMLIMIKAFAAWRQQEL